MNVWERLTWMWDVYFAITFAGTAALVLSEPGSPGLKTTCLAALCGIATTYLVSGRGLVGKEHSTGSDTMFVTVLLTLFAIATFTIPASSFILFAVSPMIFMVLPLKRASVAAGVGILLPVAAEVTRFGVTEPSLGTLLPITLLLLVFSLLVGGWTSRIVDQSRERAELIERLEASRAEVSRLSHEAGTAAERERLAREIHDTLAQGFTSIVALAQAIESELDTDIPAAKRHLGLAARTARENLAEARAMVAALTPSALAAGSLEDAVRRQAERLADEESIAVSCEVEPLPPLGMAAEVVVLRAVQEALNNVRKHANASTVAVLLSVVDGRVRLGVTDDGGGFDPDSPADGFGLRGMRARAEQVGGSVTIHSGRTEGTTVTLEVPA